MEPYTPLWGSSAHIKDLSNDRPLQNTTVSEPVHKRPRIVFDIPLPSDVPSHGAVPLEIVGDSELVVNWLNGESAANCEQYRGLVADLMTLLHNAWRNSLIVLVPREKASPWLRHVYRELNTEADAMATKAIETRQAHFEANAAYIQQAACRANIHFDGGKRDGIASCGWVLSASFEKDPCNKLWRRVASGALPLGDISSTEAELRGACEAINIALTFVRGHLCADCQAT